ncbi:hypothetical protein KJY77_06450 [Canibacter sp. lx-72]|uniref:hypothetical protein n=1 Tax=Canibacter zhuwentaonis TaxID=2837491 RepID=UPI001BDCF9ED|nr:hypothetical protein [Canibacter zhuwentaonis]MBT1018770.1 hypothetical protein [Canibacter zhuwentaonis]
MKKQLATGLAITVGAALLGGAANYIFEGNVLNAIVVTMIGFAIGSAVLGILFLSGRKR